MSNEDRKMKNRARAKKHYYKHHQEILKRQRERYHQNIESRRKYGRNYRREHADLYRESSLRHYYKNRDRYIALSKEWKSKNREHILEYARMFKKKSFASNPVFRLKICLQTRIRLALKSSHAKKCKKSAELIGTSIENLRKHLESQFKLGMSWENWGLKGWHIDHIRPLSSFNLTDPEQQKLAFHYTNLQPLWAKDNIRKGAKYTI